MGHQLPEQRRRRIIDLLGSQEAADVSSLASAFGVSAATIRRDLQQLEESGLLQRTHGGAVASGSTAFEPLHAVKAQERQAEKNAIAREAAALVEDGDVIVLDSGSTTLALARLLKRHHNLTVITADLKVALELADAPGVETILVGGQVRPGLYSIVGPTAEQNLANFRANHAFLGADAIDLEAGISNATMLEVGVKRQVIKTAPNVVLLADHSKFERTSLVRVAELDAFDQIITDDGLASSIVDRYAKRGLPLRLARTETSLS